MSGVTRLYCNSGNSLVKCGNTTTWSSTITKSSLLGKFVMLRCINEDITKLCKNIDSYKVSDRWYFDLPLAIRVCKPLCTQWRWLLNAKILVHKSPSKPMLMTGTYYEYLNAPQHIMNHSLSCQSRLLKTLSKPLYSDGDHWILTKNPSGLNWKTISFSCWRRRILYSLLPRSRYNIFIMYLL